jgi:site-specific recombinase XerD
MITIEEYVQENYSVSSYKTNLFQIKRFQDYTPNYKTAHLQDILQYLKKLRDQSKHPKTLRNALHSVKIYYRYLQHTGQRKDHPCKKLQLKDKIDKTIKTEQLYSSEQLEEYLQVTKEYKKLMVSLLIYQGLKTSEIIILKVNQINIEKAEIILHNRTLPLQSKQIYLYLEHIKNKQKEDYLFITKRNNIYKTGEINEFINKSRPKEKQILPLKIRQSVVKNLLLKNDIRVVQVFAGHKTSCTTEQYKTTHFEELKAQINQLHPLKLE